jgi:hypothetical protein
VTDQPLPDLGAKQQLFGATYIEMGIVSNCSKFAVRFRVPVGTELELLQRVLPH